MEVKDVQTPTPLSRNGQMVWAFPGDILIEDGPQRTVLKRHGEAFIEVFSGKRVSWEVVTKLRRWSRK
jgi:hypothetical protein